MIENVIVGNLSANCWIVPLNENADETKLSPCIVIDPGADASLIIARLETLCMYPRYILLTHGHFDHTGAVAELMDYFHQYEPELAIHPEDAAFINPETQEELFNSFSFFERRYASVIWQPLPVLPSILLNDNDEIGPFKVIHTPGHSLGSVCFFYQAENVLFSGDTLFAGGIGRNDGPGGSPLAMRKSLKRLLLMDAEMKVFPGHGPATTIRKEFWRRNEHLEDTD